MFSFIAYYVKEFLWILYLPLLYWFGGTWWFQEIVYIVSFCDSTFFVYFIGVSTVLILIAYRDKILSSTTHTNFKKTIVNNFTNSTYLKHFYSTFKKNVLIFKDKINFLLKK